AGGSRARSAASGSFSRSVPQCEASCLRTAKFYPRGRAAPPEALNMPYSSVVDYLDELESESIYILREAWSRIDRLAMLWSLGKDSNVMVWLTRKAFLGHVPFPVVHIDTGKKFPEMYAFRDRYAAAWGLQLIVRPCPPIEEIDPTLPPAARSAARK